MEAENEVDYSIPSPENTAGAQARTKPHDPTRLPERGSNTDESQIEVIIPTHLEDGGSPITSYGIEIDDG